MTTAVRPAILTLALLLASCQGLQPVRNLAQPLTGQVRRACGPTDGPALDFRLAAEDLETTLSLFLWRGLPDQATRLPVQRSGTDTFHGQLCQAGNCEEIERLEMTLDPTNPGRVVGTITLRGEMGASLEAEYRAVWNDDPGPICG